MLANLQRCFLPLRTSIRRVSKTPSRDWREKNNAFKERLNDNPDWSYVDGRGFGPPTPAQKNRYIRDQELAQTVVRRFKELENVKSYKQ